MVSTNHALSNRPQTANYKHQNQHHYYWLKGKLWSMCESRKAASERTVLDKNLQ